MDVAAYSFDKVLGLPLDLFTAGSPGQGKAKSSCSATDKRWTDRSAPGRASGHVLGSTTALA